MTYFLSIVSPSSWWWWSDFGWKATEIHELGGLLSFHSGYPQMVLQLNVYVSWLFTSRKPYPQPAIDQLDGLKDGAWWDFSPGCHSAAGSRGEGRAELSRSAAEEALARVYGELEGNAVDWHCLDSEIPGIPRGKSAHVCVYVCNVMWRNVT